MNEYDLSDTVTETKS